MTYEDRQKFTFNYDALDLLIDPTYDNNNSSKEGKKYQYDSEAGNLAGAEANPAGYSLKNYIEYTATYNGDDIKLSDYGITGEILVKRGSDEDFTTSTPKIQGGDELSRTVFEGLPNEQRNYASITITTADLDNQGNCTVYVVNDPSLMIGPTPYTVGNIISEDDYDGLDPGNKAKVTALTFSSTGTFYYCREGYTPASGIVPTPLTAGVTGAGGGIVNGEVTVGTVIGSTSDPDNSIVGYESIPNLQKGFTIHGISPTETSTLYVSRFSDINDLSTEKIITVIYEYNYEESDVSGLHITPVTERHVVNIHIDFKTGAPIIEDIQAPQIILPGDYLPLIPPHVIEGASPVQGGGWELYSSETDADNQNGVEYIPDSDPLYWYQHGYWLRYYALSYVGGKTYSNKVQVSVANYHDLKKVMEDKEHHYYVDNSNVKRDPKIYINDATDGMNQLKNLFDLSLLKSGSSGVTNGVVTAEGALKGHTIFTNQSQVEGCSNLEFFMRTNVNHTGTWTPIANNNGECFAGTLHGDGYYISGLDHSLFGKLCGSVYNLGVRGEFAHNGDETDADAGIAETDGGYGYVENCWVINNNKTSDRHSKPIFGSPSTTDGKYHIVNCYYQEEADATKKYTNHDGSYGIPRPMPEADFYNGTVAYNLNGFYLYKRYNDKVTTSGTPYKYYIPGVVNSETGQLVPQTGKFYAKNFNYCSSGADDVYLSGGGYVEERFADGDFRYAGGEIPTEVDERLYTDMGDNGKTKFYPIWPDDYLFFGQMLTYDWNELRPHEEVPSPITKNSGRLYNSDMSNRVYRAPAYYRNKTIGVAHFNPAVNLVAYSKPENSSLEAQNRLKKAYPGMTAIDFKGHHDVDDNGFTLGWASHTESSPYWSLSAEGKYFYPPLLDDDGIVSIVNRDETPNLLAYAPSSDNEKTFDVLTAYFTEPAYSDYYQDDDKYRCVNAAPTQNIFGHLVQSTLTATNDHLLVDEQDFNCPISYDFIKDANESTHNGTHMWYQRKPKIYVEPVWNDTKRTTKGWEAISLPFTAELVTTVKKGEITHFYSGSTDYFDKDKPVKDNTKTKVGHEYWLREYRDISGVTENKLDLPEGATPEQIAAALSEAKAEALFTYPDSKDVLKEESGVWKGWEELMDKEMKNSFLWDYYYNNSNAQTGNNHLDANLDTYQTYYKPNDSGVVNTFDDYTLLTKGVPYIIGFPGNKFYEFDLSGGNDGFEATTTADDNPEKLAEQMITFVSADGYTVGVSDDELAYMTPHVTHNGYIFHPNYLNEKVKGGSADAQGTITYKLDNGTTEGVTIYTLKADGSSYDLPQSSAGSTTPVAAPVAFRPYFTAAPSGARPVTRSIIFSNEDTELKGVEEKGDPRSDEATGSLMIYAKRHKIVVESALTYTTDVRIVNTAGITVNTFTIEPGETIETRIYNSGVYIVLTTDGHYTKKLSVR